MKLLILLLLIGILLTSLVFAQTYKTSTSSSFTIINESSNTNIVNEANSNLTIIWLCVGIALFLGIIYILFNKHSKPRSKKKKY